MGYQLSFATTLLILFTGMTRAIVLEPDNYGNCPDTLYYVDGLCEPGSSGSSSSSTSGSSKVSKGGYCSSSSSCQSNLICTGSHCCTTSEFYATGTCKTKLGFKQGTCTSESQCQSTLSCISSKCDCSTSQYFDGTCKDQLGYNQGTCTSTSQCQPTLSCISGKCDCSSSQYFDTTCKTKFGYKQGTCTSISQCQSTLSCINDRCDCSSSQYFDGTCKDKLGHNQGTCSATSQCQPTLLCISGKCDCSSTQYFDATCKNRLGRNQGTCTSTSQCQSTLSCISGECDCSSTQYFDTICKNSLGHTEPCSASVMNMCKNDYICLQDKAKKVFRCLCDETKFYRPSGCTLIDQLKPSRVSVTERLTDGVNFTWTANTFGLSTTQYKIKWESVNSSLDTGETQAAEDGGFVNGLTPGREYKFEIMAILPANEFYSQKSVGVQQTLETLPASSGLVNTVESKLDGPPYILRFQPSDGDAVKYRISIFDGNSTMIQEVTSPEVNLSNLKPDTPYLYTIIAFNKAGDRSPATSGSFKTTTQAAEDTKEDIDIILIAGLSVAAVIVLAIFVTIIILVLLRRKRKALSKRPDDPTPSEKPKKKADKWSYSNRSPDGNIYDYIQDGPYQPYAGLSKEKETGNVLDTNEESADKGGKTDTTMGGYSNLDNNVNIAKNMLGKQDKKIYEN